MKLTDAIGNDGQPWMADGDCTRIRPETPAEHQMMADRWFIETPANAKSLCGSCPAQTSCLSWALDFRSEAGGRIEGIWGATTTEQRARIRSGRPLDNRQPCGTVAGYERHRRANEPSCADCRAANAEASRVKDAKRKGAAA
jgi:hypothetical protein